MSKKIVNLDEYRKTKKLPLTKIELEQEVSFYWKKIEEISWFVRKKIWNTIPTIRNDYVTGFNYLSENNLTRFQNSSKFLNEIITENKFNLKTRRNLQEFVKLKNNWIKIWKLFFVFDYFFWDSYDSGSKELQKYGLIIPTESDVDETIRILPWKDSQEKRYNFIKLLWFIHDNEINIWIAPDKVNKWVSKIKNSILDNIWKILKKDISQWKILQFNWNESYYSNFSRDNISIFCWVRI